MDELNRKIMRIQCIRPYHIRWRALYGVGGYNKVQYRIRNMNTAANPEWGKSMDESWHHVVEDMFQSTVVDEVVRIQINMATKMGGFGLRQPTLFSAATRFTALTGHISLVTDQFNIAGMTALGSLNCTVGAQAVEEGVEKLREEMERALVEMNTFLGPEFSVKPDDSTTYGTLLDAHGQRLRQLYDGKATERQKAVRNALAVTGAQNVWRMPVNTQYGFSLTNQQMAVYLPIVTGHQIRGRDGPCGNGRCREISDKFGVHGMICPTMGGRIRVHDAIKKHIGLLAERAGYDVRFEERYGKLSLADKQQLQDEGARTIVVDEEVKHIDGRCGDVVIEGWFNDGRFDTALYGDVVVGNVTAPSYVKQAARKQQYVAKMWEKKKRDKYENPRNFVPLAMEFPGSIGPDFKMVLQTLANKVAMVTNKPRARVMSRMRTEIVITMIKETLRNIIRSMKL